MAQRAGHVQRTLWVHRTGGFHIGNGVRTDG